MKKILTIFSIIMILAIILTGCSHTKDTTPTKPNSNSNIVSTKPTIPTEPPVMDIDFHVVDLRTKEENEKVITGKYYIYVIKDITEMTDEIVAGVDKNIREYYEKDFSTYFPDGIMLYEITKQWETDKYIILIGKINNYDFCTLYSKKIYTAASPKVKELTVKFVCEIDEKVSYINQMLEMM